MGAKTLREAMKLDGRENGYLHWFDGGPHDDALQAAVNRAKGGDTKLRAEAIRLADRDIDAMVNFVEVAWADAAAADRKRWTKEDLLSTYRDGVIEGIEERLRGSI